MYSPRIRKKWVKWDMGKYASEPVCPYPFWKKKFWFREKKSAPIPKLSTDIETHIKFRSHTNMGSPFIMVSLSTTPGRVRFKIVLISTNSRYSTIFKNKLFWILEFWTESTEFWPALVKFFQVLFIWQFFLDFSKVYSM